MSASSDHGPALAAGVDAEVAAEFAALNTEAGRRLLDLVAEVDRPGPAEIARWRKIADVALVSAAVRVVETRRKAAAKFTRSDRMWLSVQGLEQATSEAVARHKARRFMALGPNATVVDLCSGIGGDSIAIGANNRVVAVDLDPAMASRMLWNAKTYDVLERVEAVSSRAEGFAIPSGAFVHVDPDRRTITPRKTNILTEYSPGLETLLGWVRSTRGGAIKLGPASDFADHFGGPNSEIEVVSLRRECKEATVWFGALAVPGVRRRATVLPSGETWTDRDGGMETALFPTTPRGPLDRWVYDPDPALIRSGLLDGFARANGWTRIASGIDLLTGPERSPSALVASFEVVDEFPLDLKILRREVATRGLGPLEIKTRGLSIRPEAYRAQLRPEGSNPATWILVAGRDGPGRAILALRG